MSIAEDQVHEAPMEMDPEEAARQRRKRMDKIGRWLIPIIVGALTIYAWDRVVVVNEIPHYILPRPGLVAKTLMVDWGTLVGSLFITLKVAAAALLAAVIGGVGLAVGSTLMAAMVAQARVGGPLFAVIAFPILLPLLKFAIEASIVAMSGEPPGASLSLVFLYDSMVTVAALMLFPVVWNP